MYRPWEGLLFCVYSYGVCFFCFLFFLGKMEVYQFQFNCRIMSLRLVAFLLCPPLNSPKLYWKRVTTGEKWRVWVTWVHIPPFLGWSVAPFCRGIIIKILHGDAASWLCLLCVCVIYTFFSPSFLNFFQSCRGVGGFTAQSFEGGWDSVYVLLSYKKHK